MHLIKDLTAKGWNNFDLLMEHPLISNLAGSEMFVLEKRSFRKNDGQNPAELDVTKSHSKHQSVFIVVVGNPCVNGCDQNVYDGLNSWKR